MTATEWPFLGLRNGDMGMVDSDGDGLPDTYETEVGLNPNNANDGAAIADNGYSNLEIFLNGVANGNIDKTKYESLDITAISAPDDDNSRKSISYNLNGTKTNEQARGLIIIKDGNDKKGKAKKIIRK